MYGNFDIILEFLDHFSALYPPHAPCDLLFILSTLLTLLMEC